MVTTVGDASAASCLSEEEVNNRVQLFVAMEDPTIVMDLRHLHSGQKSKYDVFWEQCEKFLQEEVGLAVEERRHSQVTHLARVISVRDLLQQVTARCPPSTPIPSRSWLSLQFWPKNVHAQSKIHYTGRFKVKYMVQARQFRKDHEDAHFAAAVFRYQRECAVKFRDQSIFVCMDDKHRIKIGEPNYPVAAAERGKRVLVRKDEVFEVGDHDFTKFSMIPSVSLLVDIPCDVTESWYSGKVFVGLKEGVFQPSSPHRHVTELCDTLENEQLLSEKSLLFVYSDGGPDHRLTYLSVQLSLISIYLKLDLDFLCAARTAPFHSWRNPAERMMSIVNLGLQCVGMMRGQMSPENEAAIAHCNNMSQIRLAGEKTPDLIPAILDSVAPVKILLTDILQRLELHGEKFCVFPSATEQEMKDTWSVLMRDVDVTLKYGEQYRKSSLQNHPKLVEFMSHCCQSRHYAFCIKKCGQPSCELCRPVRMPRVLFDQLHFLPDPQPGQDGHYQSFSDVFGKPTSEEFRPSLQTKKVKQKSLPFVASVQHVKNVQIMIQCEECEMWRLVYSKFKLTADEKKILQSTLDDWTYTCGAQLQDLDLQDRLQDIVAMRVIRCQEPVEKLYYTAGIYEDICIHCCSNKNLSHVEHYYPQCSECNGIGKDLIKKRC